MLISGILKSKGSRVVTVDPTKTVVELARLFNANRIAAAVVVDVYGKFVGLVSERDVVQLVSTHGGAALRMRVGDFMGRRPPTCKPDDSVKKVMEVMTYRRARHLPVMIGNEICGIVSIGDIVKSHLDETQLEVDVLRDYAHVHVA